MQPRDQSGNMNSNASLTPKIKFGKYVGKGSPGKYGLASHDNARINKDLVAVQDMNMF